MNKIYTTAIGGGLVFALIWFALSGFEDPHQAALGGGAFALAYILTEAFFKEKK
ncbi:MAG: hypothetical protein ACQEP6_03195 [Patescibacteria group bacterium]